jgi:uncharacterized OsmC-like protein
VADYSVHAASTAVFGRVMLDARDQHLVIDGPAANGCPGEALTPAEAFLGGVASCAVELVQVIARSTDTPLDSVATSIEGTIDRAHEIRDDVTIFSSVALHFDLRGPLGDEDAAQLVAAFKGR